MARVRMVLWVALGLGLGLGLREGQAWLARRAGAPPPEGAARLRAVVDHERARGNGVVEVDATAERPALVDLPRGAFAVFAAVGATAAPIVLDAGAEVGTVTLARLTPAALPNAGLGPAWRGRLAVRLRGAPAARLAFFSDPRTATR